MVGKLTARRVTTAPAGKYSDGGGLYLIVEKTGSRRWQFHYSTRGKRREMGLGSVEAFTLAEARDKAIEARRLIAAGTDPIVAKNDRQNAAARKPTFGEIADELIDAKQSGWRNAIHAKQWLSSLTKTAAALRPLAVDEIDTAAVLAVLKPIWLEKPEAAMRLRQRIEATLDAAKAQGHRTGENPATWRGHLAHLLPGRPNVAKQHYAAMPYSDVPQFMARLRDQDTTAARALEFAVLTASRSGEVYRAKWSEIDLPNRVWTIPPERMKSGRQHRVPLSERAAAILVGLAKIKGNEFVFTGHKAKCGLSHVTMAKVMSRLDVTDATPHGFRSSFRDWAGNETAFPREIAEAALAHTVGDSVEQAYRRSDALERRRELMQAWANYCEPSAKGNVIRLKKSGGSVDR